MGYLSHLPPFMRELLEIAAIAAEIDAEHDQLLAAMAALDLDTVISTASAARIAEWEQALGIIAQDRTLDQRRQFVLSQIRGAGKLNEAKIRAVVTAFLTVRDSTVVFDPETSLVEIHIIPVNWWDLFDGSEIERALEPQLPAHLALPIDRAFNDWQDIADTYDSWADIKATAADWAELKNKV